MAYGLSPSLHYAGVGSNPTSCIFLCTQKRQVLSSFFYKGYSSVLERVYTVYSKVSEVILFLFLFCFFVQNVGKKGKRFLS